MTVARKYFQRKFGFQADVDAAQDITDVDSTTTHYPTVGFLTEILGGLADHVDSSGVHTVEVHGLNFAGIEVTEVATLNAVTGVNLANSYYRINRMFVLTTSQSALSNSFDIIARHVGSATLSTIKAGQGQTQQTLFTMPVGVNGGIKRIKVSAGRASSFAIVNGTVRLQIKPQGQGWRDKWISTFAHDDHADQEFGGDGISVPAMADVRMRVTAINTTNVAVSGEYEIEGTRIV